MVNGTYFRIQTWAASVGERRKSAWTYSTSLSGPSGCGAPESNPSTDSFDCLCRAEFQVSPCRLTGNPKLTSQLSLGPHSRIMTSRLSGNVTRCTNSGADWHGVCMWWLCYCVKDTKDLLLKFEVSHVPSGKRTRESCCSASCRHPQSRSWLFGDFWQFGFWCWWSVTKFFFCNEVMFESSLYFLEIPLHLQLL